MSGSARRPAPADPTDAATPAGSLSPLEADLLDRARSAAEAAYAPYSRYHVGAAVRCADGRVFAAPNVENASYGLSLCAEANAIAAAAAAGHRRLTHVAVVGFPAGAAAASRGLATPCGRCRQMMAEFAPADLIVLVRGAAGEPLLRTSLGALLPHAFGPAALGGG